MAEVTENLALSFRLSCRLGNRPTATTNEISQLVYAWLCLNMLRGMAASGERQAIIDYLTDSAQMAKAVDIEYRRDT